MLELILKAREERWKKRCQLANSFKASVVTVIMNIPGPDKRLEQYIRAHTKFTNHFIDMMEFNEYSIVSVEKRVSFDGPEVHIVSEEEPSKLKSLAVQIEKNHPLGRIVDIDVMDKNQKTYSRRDIGETERQCLVCNRDARHCIIERKHDLSVLLNIVNGKISKYLKEG